jgi:hypothetical protein
LKFGAMVRAGGPMSKPKTTDEQRLKKLQDKIDRKKKLAAAKQAIIDARANLKKLRG